jgi:hypothetical protein
MTHSGGMTTEWRTQIRVMIELASITQAQLR